MTSPQATQPIRLSVVIGSHNTSQVIVECLSALERQADLAAMEIIVADSSSDGTDELIRRRFPSVRLLHFEEPLGVPQLRGRGIAAAHGAIVAILDPYSVADDNWSSEILRAHDTRPNAVIGGTVDLYRAGEQSLAAWTLYINEYGMFMSPVRGGDAWIVPGSNVAYKREVLFDGDTPRQKVFWKTFVNWKVEEGGSALWLEPRIRVALNKPIPLSDYFRTRFWHGRCFAGLRVSQTGWPHRLLRAASTPLIPFLLCYRWGRVFWPKGPRRGMFLLTLPMQLVLFGAWAVGELQGYLFGAGDTCGKLYY